MGMRARIYPINSGMLWRRWQPGQGYRADPGVTGIGAYLGFSGLGDDDEDCPFIDDTGECSFVDPSGSVTPIDYVAAGMGPGYNMTSAGVAPDATPEEIAAEKAAAEAWLLQNVPAETAAQAAANTVDPNLLKTLALTATQIATGVQAGTVRAVPAAMCPSGYQYSSGVCVPPAAKPAGVSLIPGVTNQQLATWGGVVFAGLLLITVLGKK